MNIERKPNWLKTKVECGPNYAKVKQIVETNQLHTICSSGKCPNMGECWSLGTATFMILGDICTRSCKFCATKTGRPLPVDSSEIEKVAESIALMGLKHCVITSVDRDDLEDGGAAHWAAVVRSIRERNPKVVIELLLPDFDFVTTSLDTVLKAGADIVGHNMETVERLTPLIRSRAKYKTSLQVIAYIANSGAIAKSGIMVGLGEQAEEVQNLMSDLRKVGCKLLTIGQYLRPSLSNIEVVRYVTPEEFESYKQMGREMGFDHVESGPLVRSSYMAERSFQEATK